MRKFIMIIMGVALIALPTMAQVFEQQSQQYGATAPNAQIQSTSTFTGSGSSYSSNPTLNSDGTATYNGASYSPAKVHGGLRRDKEGNTSFGEWEEGSPIGDAVLPLLALACVYAVYSAVRRKRSARV